MFPSFAYITAQVQVLGTGFFHYVYDEQKVLRSPGISFDLGSLHGSTLMIGVYCSPTGIFSFDSVR